MKDDMARKGADALLRGAKMLGYACPVCKMPLYQFPSGEIRCINCDKEVKIVRSNEEAEQIVKASQMEQGSVYHSKSESPEQELKEREVQRKKHERSMKGQWNEEINELIKPTIRNLSKKLEMLSEKLLEVDDAVEIMRITELIKGISEGIKALKDV